MNDTLIAILLIWIAITSTTALVLRIMDARRENWTFNADTGYSEENRRDAPPLTQTIQTNAAANPEETQDRVLTANDMRTQNPLTKKRAPALEGTYEKLGYKRN